MLWDVNSTRRNDVRRLPKEDTKRKLGRTMQGDGYARPGTAYTQLGQMRGAVAEDPAAMDKQYHEPAETNPVGIATLRFVKIQRGEPGDGEYAVSLGIRHIDIKGRLYILTKRRRETRAETLLQCNYAGRYGRASDTGRLTHRRAMLRSCLSRRDVSLC